MEFEVGQWVKFKNHKEYIEILNVGSNEFARKVNFGDTFKVIKSEHLNHVYVEKDGYHFWCKNKRLVLASSLLHEAEEL